MDVGAHLSWLTQSKHRQSILTQFNQPLTVQQITRRLWLRSDSCSEAVCALARRKILKCLTPMLHSSRVYWLTLLGKACQRRLLKDRKTSEFDHFVPEIDWDLYAWVCFSHRSTIIKTLQRPMQAADIKRQARRRDDRIRMSANNVRDIMYLLLERDIVRRVYERKKKHPRYELTEYGRVIQTLLQQAEVRV